MLSRLVPRRDCRRYDRSGLRRCFVTGQTCSSPAAFWEVARTDSGRVADKQEVGLFGVKLTYNGYLGQLHRRWVGGIGPNSLVRDADFHVSICQWKTWGLPGALARAPKTVIAGLAACSLCLSAMVPALRRTGHPFPVSGPRGPSPKIECVFAASPETIRREPREWISFAQSATCRTWQPAR